MPAYLIVLFVVTGILLVCAGYMAIRSTWVHNCAIDFMNDMDEAAVNHQTRCVNLVSELGEADPDNEVGKMYQTIDFEDYLDPYRDWMYNQWWSWKQETYCSRGYERVLDANFEAMKAKATKLVNQKN